MTYLIEWRIFDDENWHYCKKKEISKFKNFQNNPKRKRMNVLLLKFSMVIQKKGEVLSEKINLMRRKFIWNILCPEKKLFLVWPFLHAHAPRKFLNFKLIWEIFARQKLKKQWRLRISTAFRFLLLSRESFF